MALGPLDIHPDIARARTLPFAVYRDREWYERLRENVFARTWHVVGDVEQLLGSGEHTAAPHVLLPDCLDEPLLLTRAADGLLRCLANVCTHRGSLLLQEPGRPNALRCPYHGRCFRLDGSFVSMPEFDGVADFPAPADDLPAVPSARWSRLLLASPRPAVPFHDVLAPLRSRLDWLADGLEHWSFDAAGARDYDVPANWAMYVDNYQEGFHLPWVHPALTRTLDYPAYRTELYEHATLQVAPAADGEPAFTPPRELPEHGERIAAYHFWLFPATMLNFYPWGLSLNVVQPRGPEATRVLFRSFVRDPSLRARGAGGDLHTVEMEDEAIVALVQRGVRSRLVARGRYSVTQERGVHHFHRLLARHA